ncbi:MAG TPA: hypothetical protein VN851_18425 [Thermoanaerobaculia bacterium]|nr:hypothetical protein [Thermoanaerobaculia bacterium]
MSEGKIQGPGQAEATVGEDETAAALGSRAVAAGKLAIGGGVQGDVHFHEAQQAPPPVAVPPRVSPTRLPRTTDQLFGRETELADLGKAWADPRTHVLSLVAWGGVGKTSLVAQWAADLAARDYDGADYFDWSFYSQGTQEAGAASGEPFLAAALRFFGGEEGENLAAGSQSAEQKGTRLAEFLAQRRTLLILDGLEPLQNPPSSLPAGQIKDLGVRTLLKSLAQRNRGLCVVTTRESVSDLASFRKGTAPEWLLERLEKAAGVALLEKLHVKGSKKELEKLVEDVAGHALTLNLLGTFLRDAHGGDVRKRDLVKFEEANREEQGGHAFRVIAAYEEWLAPRQTLREKVSEWFSGKRQDRLEGERQLAILRLLGLFDRPATSDCVAALRRAPRIPGLTEPLVGLSDSQWNLAISRLADRGLASADDRGTLDAHPLLREYFARQLSTTSPEAWRAAHGRLFEHLRDSTPQFPDTLEGLQSLYQAVAHGCHAQRQQEACIEIYWKRILRGNEGFSRSKLGAIGADLGAVACFFDTPWSRVSPTFSKVDQAWLLNEAAFRLRALGRLTEALEPMRAGLANYIGQENGAYSARLASNLSELELTLGDVAAAVRDAEQSVTFADQGEDAFQRTVNRTAHAEALHQAGRRAEALALLREAERLQEEWKSQYPRLYSLPGFRYCDLLLAEAERAAGQKGGPGADGAALSEALREVEERGAEALDGDIRAGLSVLTIALHHLTLGRTALYRSILEGSDLAAARSEIEAAVDGIRHAGQSDYLPLGLLTRAWLFSREGNSAAARADLDEAQEIAERGPMPLYLADIALYRGRLFNDRAALAEARRLIEKHGYGRRLEELADAEAAL